MNELKNETFYENSLSQHGVEGQKWGVMHGPPYPLTGENKKAFKVDKILRSFLFRNTIKEERDKKNKE